MIYLLRQAVADSLRVAQSMPNVVLVAFTLALGMNALRIALPGSSLLTIAIELTGAFLVSLYFVTVHRFVILGEVAAHYPFAIGPRNWRFFFNAVLLAMLSLSPVVIVAPLVAAYKYATILSLFSWLLVAVAIAAFFLILVLIARLVIVLPAIAIEASGASWANAYRDTRGHAFRIFLTYALATVLIGLVSMLMFLVFLMLGKLTGVLIPQDAAVVTIARVGAQILLAALKVLGWTFFVAIASRLFMGLANRTTAPVAI